MAISGLDMIAVGRRRRQQNQVVRWTNRGFSGVAVSISVGRTQRQPCPLEQTQRCEFFGETIRTRQSGGQMPWSEGRARELGSGLGEGRLGDRMIRTTGTPLHGDRVSCSFPVSNLPRVMTVGNDRLTFREHEVPGLLSAAT